MARAVGPLLPQQTACPAADARTQALVAILLLPLLTRHQPRRPDLTADSIIRVIQWQPQQGVAASPVSPNFQAQEHQGPNCANPQPCSLHRAYLIQLPAKGASAARLPSQGTLEPGAAVRPDRRSPPPARQKATGARSGLRNCQPQPQKGPQASSMQGNPRGRSNIQATRLSGFQNASAQ
ncbi:hypothetical protein NDU88_009735 [Pleurodeles waltl]|uniref:Uncharacterized protein n=1 Tax=Pleurodeles waltl TaxID=8319 RepID=A0AAV7QVX3_PLEWA|nr:hypothetical protein NDU88_009735 [Pleurodeles waltl]